MTDPSIDADELAGVVGLFGALTRDELRRAWSELAFKRDGTAPPEEAITSAITSGVADHHLVEQGTDGEAVLVPGPAAFPTLPEFAEDLPHLMDVPERDTDRDAIARELVASLAAERAEADADTRRELEQLSYDVEAWANVDATPMREDE